MKKKSYILLLTALMFFLCACGNSYKIIVVGGADLLISCPKCGNTISEYSDVCPHCGHPIRKEKEKKRRALYATLGTCAVIIAITAVVILLSYLAGRKKAAA